MLMFRRCRGDDMVWLNGVVYLGWEKGQGM
jgi:hypothetical protein